VADFVANFGHEWAGSRDSSGSKQQSPATALDFADMAWQFLAGIQSK
jgi:hypothetical protein